MGIMNPGSDGRYPHLSQEYRPGQETYWGAGTPNGFGHWHHNPNNGFDRPPGGNRLG